MSTNSNQTQHKKLTVSATLAQAKSHIKKGQFTEARQLYHSILETFPQNQQAKKGLIAIQHGSVSQKNQSSPSQAQIDTVIALYAQGQIAETLNAIAILTKDYPNESLLYNLSGVCYKALGQLDAAVSSYERALAINPNYADAHYNLAITFKALGQLDAAVSSYELSLAINPNNAIAHNNLGNVLKELGQLDAAVSSYQRALAINPDYVEAHSNLGTTLRDLGQLDAAVSSFERALAINPDYVEAHSNLGATLRDLGQLDAAVSCCERALAIRPDYSLAHNNLGDTLRDLGQLNAAVSSYERALAINPNNAITHNNLGNVLKDIDQLDAAVSSYERALAINPDYVEALNNVAEALNELGQQEAAVSSCKRALAINPDYVNAHVNLGCAFNGLNQFDAAISSFERALAIEPNDLMAHFNLGVTYQDHDNLDAAISCFGKVLAINPDAVEAHSGLGSLYYKKGQFDAAVSSCKRALAINPDYVYAHLNLGVVYDELNQIDAAVNSYERALTIQPDAYLARFNLSQIQLFNDLLSEGFKNYEARWQWKDFPSPQRKFSAPRWTGQSLADKNILIWGEQGIGDEIRFASLIPEFKDLGCNVGIECAAKLVELFQWSFPWAEVRVNGAVNCEGSEFYGLFDYQIPMGSIAPLFRTTLDDFRIFQKPYIPRLKEGELKVRKNLNLEDGQLLIGLCWRSGLQTRKRSKNYITVEDLAPYRAIKNAVFLGVQYDDCLPELDRVRELGLPIRYYTDIDQKNDLASTAALIGACDLVISADTTVFQMSGALGVPTIQFDGYSRSKQHYIPWFPTVRHLQLNPGEPSLLINNIIHQMPALITWANEVTTSGRQINSYSS